MPVGIAPRDVLQLVRETQRGPAPPGPIVVVGSGASEVAEALRAGGDRALVTVGGDPGNASALLLVHEAPLSDADRAALRRAARGSRPVIALARGAEPLSDPHVL
ncbi:MAG: hypothetical protein ACRC50_01110, partial [Gaiella sp.]